MYSQSSLCIEYKALAEWVFKRLELDRVINHQTSEETITDEIIRRLKIWKINNSNSKFSIREFTKQQEAINGADFEWDWYFVDSSGKNWLGFRIQAKVLNLKSNRFLSLDHSNKNGHQLNLLVNSSNSDSRIPFYCFYLYKDNESPLKGCSLSSPNNVNQLLKIDKKPKVDDVLKISFPWHKMFCNQRCKKLSLPSKLLLNLKNLGFDNVTLLNKEEISDIKNFLNNDSDTYDVEEYPFSSSPDRVTIIRENKEYD